MRKTLLFIFLLSVLACFGQEQTADSVKSVENVEKAGDGGQQPVNYDSVHISLLTCGAYDEVWTLYGHSALRIEDRASGQDWAVNYGLFDFQQPFFVLRFVFGKCDYLMGIVSFDYFMREFSSRGASVLQQELNLTAEEKEAVLQAVVINSLPQNCMYRYNFFYDNCATRPRNIILDNIPDRIIYNNVVDSTISFRDLIHQHNAQKPWARMGSDLLLGVNADRQTTRADQQFLPDNLMRDFAQAQFVDKDGNRRPVVVSTKWLLGDNATYAQEFPLSPRECALLLLFVIVAATVYERMKGRNFWIMDAVLFGICGILGLVLFVMVFSEHPTVSLNLQILGFNPLIAFFLWRLLPELRRRKRPLFCKFYALCLLLSVCGMTVQDYAEGYILVVVAMLVRVLSIIGGVKEELKGSGVKEELRELKELKTLPA
ncbi:MAG: DUF4105 domain-containing protein [Bacteroidaceae bacterium]|nr:DUF4105 domain-containing protein [Bacteroidaceae bacterium]